MRLIPAEMPVTRTRNSDPCRGADGSHVTASELPQAVAGGDEIGRNPLVESSEPLATNRIDAAVERARIRANLPQRYPSGFRTSPNTLSGADVRR